MPKYNLQLIHFKSVNESAIISKLIEITELNQEKASKIIQKQGVIQRNVAERDARRMAGQLEIVGAKVMLLPVGRFELPGSKPLFVQLNNQKNQPLAEAQVSIVTRHLPFDRNFPPAKSNSAGRVSFLNFSDLITKSFKVLPPVWFEVTLADERLTTVRQTFSWDTFIQFPDTVFEVQVQTAERPPKPSPAEPPVEEGYAVSGKVFLPNEAPATDYIVQAYDRDLRSEQLLGEATTDEEGRYRIPYTPEQFRREEKSQADLRLRVLDSFAKEVAIQPLQSESDTLYNAAPATEIDLYLEAEAPLANNRYQLLLKAIRPLLDGATLSELSWEDARILSQEVDFSTKEIFWVAEDKRLISQTGLPASVFFAWALQEIGVDDESNIPALDLAEVLSLDADTLVNEHLGTAIEKEHINNLLADSGFREQLITQLERLQETTTEEPLRVKRKRMDTISKLAGLEREEASHLKALKLDHTIVTADLVDNLVAEGKLSAAKKEPLKFTLSLNAFTKERTELVEKLLKEPVRNQEVAIQLKDFAIWDKQQWQNFIEKNDIQPDSESDTQAAYATTLNQRMEQLYPTDTWFARNADKDHSEDWKKLDRIAPLFEHNETLFKAGVPTAVSLEGIENPEETQEALIKLNKLANLYEPLGLVDAFNKPSLSVQDKINFADKQVGLLKTFRTENPDFDLASTPMSVFSEEANFQLDAIPESEHTKVLNTLKREQRLLQVSNSVSESQILAQYGFKGALDIMANSRQEFINSPAGRELERAAAIYDKAKVINTEALRRTFVIKETTSVFNNTLAGNLGEDLDALRRMPGYEDLFGTASYCECQHCQSVFSPAAYFVDLMRWCEDYVPNWQRLNPDFHSRHSDTLSLKRRRPDLWNLPLTCDNTNKLIPTLSIVNEVLERFIASEVRDPDTDSSIDISSEKVVQELVYGKILNRCIHTHTLPLSLPHYRVTNYLDKVGVSRKQAAALQAQEANWSANYLNLSAEAYQLIVSPRLSGALLAELYPASIVGVTTNTSNTPQSSLSAIEVAELLQALALDRDELGVLVTIPFIHEDKVAIELKKRSFESVQTDHEVLTGMTFQTLDRMHRFVRLWRLLPAWSMGELGLFLQEGVHDQIDDGLLEHIPHYLFLQDRLEISPEKVFSIVYKIAEQATEPGQKSLLDRQFNPVLFTATEEGLSGELVFTHPINKEGANSTGIASDSASLNRFLNALRISDDDFVRLLEVPLVQLHAPYSFVPTLDNLSILYTHTTLTRQLGISIEELLLAIRLCPSITTVTVGGSHDIIELVDFVTAVQATGISWEDLNAILPDNTSVLEAIKPNVLKAIFKLIKAERSLEFSRETFALIPKVELSYAYALFDQLLTTQHIVPVNNGAKEPKVFRIAKNADLSSINFAIPKPLVNQGITPERLKFHLKQYTVESTLVAYLSTALEINETDLVWMLHLTKADLSDPIYLDAIEEVLTTTSQSPVSIAPYQELIATLSPWLKLIKAMDLDTRAFHFVADATANAEIIRNVYDVTEEGMPSWETVRKLALWQQLIVIGFDNTITDSEARETQVAEHIHLFQAFVALPGTDTLKERLTAGSEETKGPIQKQLTALLTPVADRNSVAVANTTALATLADNPSLRTLLNRFKQIENDPSARLRAASLLREIDPLLRPFSRKASDQFSATVLDKLFQLLQLTKFKQELGVGIDTLSAMLSGEYSVLAKASGSLRAALSLRFGEDSWSSIAEKLDEQLSQVQRDGLQVFLLKQFNTIFRRTSDLYYYFLLDTDFGGCARTSRAKAATLSLQLYVHRIGLNLEQTTAGIEDNPEGFTIEDAIKRKDIPEKGWQEWVWLKNYRVWEANRKVFLYPENYLEPDFRDDRSTQFKALSDELLQVDLNEDSAAKAYKNYLTQFDHLANLTIAGAYYHNDENTLYVFGVSNTKECYYRKFVRQVHWTPWEKLDFPVDSIYISPIKHRGQLYIFWVEARIQEFNNTSTPKINYTQNIHCATYEADGVWRRIDFKEKTYDNLYVMNLPSGQTRLFDKDKELIEENINFLRIFPESNKGIANYKSYDNIFLRIGTGLQEVNNTTLNKFWYNSIAHSVTKVRYKVDFKINQLLPVDEWPYFINTNDVLQLKDTDRKKVIFISKAKVASNRNDKLFYYFNDIYEQAPSQVDAVKTVLLQRENIDLSVSINPVVNYHLGQTILYIDDHTYLAAVGNYIKKNGEYLWTPWIKRLATTVAPIFKEIFNEGGLKKFITPTTQNALEEDFPFFAKYRHAISVPNKAQKINFNGVMGSYFQELFFHIPFKIAHQLNANQRFREAQEWLHYIFNPMQESNYGKAPNNFWNYIPFHENSIQSLRAQLTNESASEAYRQDPFNPFAIARLRIGAFQKTVFMKYIDNLLDWGDHLFAQDTMETLNEANMLYVMASDLLGPRHRSIGRCDLALEEEKRTYSNIKKLRKSEFFYEMEHTVTTDSGVTTTTHIDPVNGESYETSISATSSITTQLPVFCVPENSKLLSYWTRVEDRLYKLRNCMSIKGMKRQLTLFQPPIDPAMLVRARAAGMSLAEVVASVNSPLPLYRFAYLLERAKSYTAQVQGFGNTVLNLIEKKEASKLTLMLNEQQQVIQSETRKIKEQRFAEIAEQYNALEVNKEKTRLRKAYITELASENNQDGNSIGGQYGWSDAEKNQIKKVEVATNFKSLAGYFNTLASIAFATPQTHASTPPAVEIGGQQFGAALSSAGILNSAFATLAEMQGTRSSLVGSWKRRHKEWMQQLSQLEQEEAQLETQTKLLDIRKEIAEQDLTLFDTATTQTKELYEYHKSKFTNEQLYTWLLAETQKMYRETYRTAQEMAKLAEQAYHFERDEDQEIYIQGGHWDGGRQGLLSGEKLSMQLQRMEQAYIKNDQRDLEIDQVFSLMQIDPKQLLALRSTGECTFTIPEFLFDLTYPGHYRRKIKSVRLTIPCITGPYTNVGLTLTLLDSKIRMEARVDGELIAVPRAKNDSIATSKAQNDGGQFTLDFNGARYLPFEGAGAVESTWKIDLPNQFRSFDYQTIADVLIHVSYTAKDGIPRDKVNDKLQTQFQDVAENGLYRVLSFQQEFSSEFHRILHHPAGEEITINLKRKHFPFFLQYAKSITVSKAHFFIHTTNDPKIIGDFKLAVNNNEIRGFEKIASDSGIEPRNLFEGKYPQDFSISQDETLDDDQDTISVTMAIEAQGDLASENSQSVDHLKDIILLMEYHVTF